MITVRCGRCQRDVARYRVRRDGGRGVIVPVGAAPLPLGYRYRCPEHGAQDLDLGDLVKAAMAGWRSLTAQSR
jgi:hypothetical protein